MFTTEEVEGFIQEYKRSKVIIESTVRNYLNKAIEFGNMLGKPFYDFTADEVMQLYTRMHAVSTNSLQNANLVLKNASRWFLYNRGLSLDNVYEHLTKDDFGKAVDVRKRDGLIFSRSDIDEIQANLFNKTDKAIIEMLFQGFGGDLLKELTFFEPVQIGRHNTVNLITGKQIVLPFKTINLLTEACAETKLITFGISPEVREVSEGSIYKIAKNNRYNSLNWNDPQDVMRRYRFVYRRLKLISKEFGVNLTGSSIQSNGLLYFIQLEMARTNLRFKDFVETEEARALAVRYDIYSDYYKQTLIEKYRHYFSR